MSAALQSVFKINLKDAFHTSKTRFLFRTSKLLLYACMQEYSGAGSSNSHCSDVQLIWGAVGP
jgi:hypothetical protein